MQHTRTYHMASNMLDSREQRGPWGLCASGRFVETDMARASLRGRAFTLIELLVVIAIIAVMVGILLPALGTARSEARTTKCAANARTIAQAVATYGADYKGRIPPS